MLSRLISKTSRLQPLLSFVSSHTINTFPKSISGNPFLGISVNKFYPKTPGFVLYSTKDGNGKLGDADLASDLWKLSSETDVTVESVFGEDTGSFETFIDEGNRNEEGVTRSTLSGAVNGEGNVFDGGAEDIGGGGQEWTNAEELEPWSFGDEAEVKDVFGIELETDLGGLGHERQQQEAQINEEKEKLEMEEKALTDVLKGPNRAFGDLIESSGITDEMLDSLITLKDFADIPGLPPLSVIEEKRYQKNAGKSSRAEIERQKQEEVARARVRQVDDKGRAYGTGRRKCSIARVWIEPGAGKFVVNDKEFDVYFPMLDHRATLLRPFSETKTLGMWDVNCTVKGGGTSGQVGAIRLGISRALQNWEPGFRPPLKAAGFLTRDARVVERKKPGKAKARKSFQWVKR